MFEKYIATNEDLLAIEEGISYVYKPELNFIFKDKSKIDSTFVLSFDSQEIFLWVKSNDKWVLERYPHKEEITDQMQKGWNAGYEYRLEMLKDYLHKKITSKSWFDQSSICGGLMTPFIGIQKLKGRPNNPYTTKNSYFATIIHEFGHVYYDRHLYTRSFYWDKKENLKYIEMALDINQNNIKGSAEHLSVRIPSYKNMSELFAFCTDNSAARIFFKDHYDDIRKENLIRLPKMLKEESNIDLVKSTSLLSDPHEFARVIGSIIIHKQGDKWVDKLLECRYL